MLSTDLKKVPIMTNYDSKDVLKASEIAELVLKETYKIKYQETFIFGAIKSSEKFPKRKELFYVAGLNLKENQLIVGTCIHPENNSIIDPQKLGLEEILGYTTLKKI